MRQGFVKKAIKRTNLHYLILVVLLVLATVFLTRGLLRNYYNAFLGPFSIQAGELKQDKILYNSENKGQKYYFKVEGQEITPIGELSYPVNSTSVYTANYDLLKVGPYLIPVASHTPQTGVKLKGIFLPTPPSIHNQITEKKQNGINVEGELLPVMLDTTGAFWEDIRAQIIFGILVTLFTLYHTVVLFLRLFRKQSHPLYKGIAQQGMPEAVIESVEMELGQEELVRENYRYILTPSWLIKKGPFSYKLSKNYLTLKR